MLPTGTDAAPEDTVDDDDPGTSPDYQLPVSDPVAYREAMTEFAREATEMIAGILSEADFKSDFPNIFGDPDEVGPAIAWRNTLGVMLRKAHMHAAACLVAEQSDNLHSLAVQIRVVLECAAHTQTVVDALAEGTQEAAERVVSDLDSDAMYQYKRAYKGRADNEIREIIADIRRRLDEKRLKNPKRTKITNKLQCIVGGQEMYRWLSDRFCKFEPNSVGRTAVMGGSLQPAVDANALAFGYWLDALAGLLFMMAFGYGALMIKIGGGSRIFDEAHAGLERKRESVALFQTAVGGNDDNN